MTATQETLFEQPPTFVVVHSNIDFNDWQHYYSSEAKTLNFQLKPSYNISYSTLVVYMLTVFSKPNLLNFQIILVIEPTDSK